jgi:Fe-S-cluster-containing hydrogenase component 2
VIRLAKAKPVAIVMACEKCFKRANIKDKVTKPLKRALKPHCIKLVKARCLGVCPKNAVTLHDSRRPREWIIVANGTPAEEVSSLILKAVG